jgi:hypothetical protein
MICFVLATVAWACDDPFLPLAESEVQLSVFGYLDAAADTQWVRVMPIRSQALTSPDSFGIIVTLERLGSGRTVELRDSLFTYSENLDPGLGSGGSHLHNFWTTEPIEAGATYRFSARRNGEDLAEAVVEIPGEYEVEVWVGQGYNRNDILRIEGLNHVPFVAAKAHFFDRCGSSVDTVFFTERSSDESGHRIPIRPLPVTPREGCGALRIETRDLWMVGSESRWPSGMAFSPWALGVSEQVSNVSNAVGFLGGVHTKVLPYENCTFQGEGGAIPDYCYLRYGPEAASLRGTVYETRCGDGPVDTVTVELRELDGEPAAARKVRNTFTNLAGDFQIGALESGVRYFLQARAKPEPDPFWGEVDIYTILTDTVEFTPGEKAVYDIELRRLTQCGGVP